MASKPVVRQRGRRTSGAKRRAWLPWAIGGAVLVAVIAGFVIMRVTNTTSAAPDAGVAAVARTNAGTEVKVYTGTHHTVYHSTAPLPSETNPRADGKPTLVWFSGTYCEYCEQMEPFAHRTAAQFLTRMVFAEKAVDVGDTAAQQFAIRGTPTFVLIDARGHEITRFGFESSAAAFQAKIDGALKRAGV